MALGRTEFHTQVKKITSGARHLGLYLNSFPYRHLLASVSTSVKWG